MSSMKRRSLWLSKALVYILLGITIVTSRPVFAEEFTVNFDDDLLNTELNIKWARLIEKYLLSYNEELKDFKEAHGITSNLIIDESIESIKKLIFELRKIQTDSVEKQDAEKVMQVTIDKIKNLNKNLKVYLKNKAAQVREDAKLFQEKLVKVITPFQKKLERFILNTRAKIDANGVVSREEKRVIRYLDALEDENIKLKTFKNISFRNKNDIKSYIVSIIISIQNGMWGIKMSF